MYHGNCKFSTRGKSLGTLIVAALALAALFLFPRAASADALSSPRAFMRGSAIFIVEPQRIVFFSLDTRSSHSIYSAIDSQFTLVSAARSGDVIWASNCMGAVIAVNMQSGSVEEFGRGLAGGGGQIDVDRRFVWVASGDTLYRMDLTGREWVRLSIPGKNLKVRGLISFNDKVHVIASDAVYVLTAASEDWVVIPHKGFVLERGDYRKVNEAAYFTQENSLYRYDPSRRLWDVGTFKERIGATSLTPERLTLSAGNRLYDINLKSFTVLPLPMISVLRDIRAITTHGGRSVCAVDRGLAIYNSPAPFDFNIVAYPEHVSVGEDVFVFSYYDLIIMYTNNSFVIHNPSRRLWSAVRVINRGGERKYQHRWDENGTFISLTEEHQSTLNGTLTLRQEPSGAFTGERDGFEFELGSLSANMTMALHTEDPDGRVLDIVVDNAFVTTPPEKGFYYKGLESDIFSRASFGVQGSGLAAGQVTPDAVTEGASAVFSSITKTENRDKSFLTAAAGGGHVLSKTEWRSFKYSLPGVYHLLVEENRSIVVSSVKVYVDGVPLSGTDYYYDHSNRAVRLLRRDKTDPTSLIQVSFSVKALPDDKAAVELFPENHFGQYGFVEGTVSPRSWFSARGGLLAMGDDEAVSPTILAGLPVELRGGANRSLLIHPEVAYDSKKGAHSTGVTLGARESRAFGSYRGLWVGHDYGGIDRYGFDNRNLNDEHEVNLGYDLRDNLRAEWFQFHRRADGGALSHFEARSSYTGKLLPDIELSLSSRTRENSLAVEDRSRKETFALRLSDPSSRILGEMNRLHNVGYDFSWTEYNDNADSDRRGRVVYGAANVSPMSSLTFSGSGMYQSTRWDPYVLSVANPALSVNMRGLPRGFDMNVAYSVYAVELGTDWSNVDVGRGITGFFYPGEYAKSLEKFSIFFGYYNEMASYVPPNTPLLTNVFLGDDYTHLVNNTEQFGVIYFPMENLFLSSLNSRFNDLVNPMDYSTSERVKLWFENGSSLESNLHVVVSSLRLYLNLSAFYEHKWSDGFLTGLGAFGTGEDRGGELVNARGGPQLVIAQTKEFNGFIRNIENSHLFWATFYGEEVSNPDLEYSLLFRMKMPPNISLVAELHMFSKRLRKAGMSGGIYLHAGF